MVPLAVSVLPYKPMASYWLSDDEKLLLVKVGLASNAIATGVIKLEAKLLEVMIGLDAFSILKPWVFRLNSQASIRGLALSVSTPMLAYLILALLKTQLVSTLELRN